MPTPTPRWYYEAEKTHGAWMHAHPEASYGEVYEQLTDTLATSRSAAGRWKTWVLQRDQLEHAIEEETAPVEAPRDGLKDKVWSDNEKVVTDLGPDYGLKVMTRGEYRSFIRDYSVHWGGRSFTQAEMAINYKFPTTHAVAEFVRIHGLRKNSAPFEDAEFESEDTDALIDKTLASKKQAFFLKLQEREQKAIKADAEKWRAFEMNANLIAQSVNAIAHQDVAPLNATPAPEPYALFVNLTDLHYGKLAYNHAGERVYDRAEAARRARASLRDLIEQSLMLGRGEEIWLIVGSDFLHIDNLSGSTTRLTGQAGQLDGDYREVLSEGAALMIELVKIARAVAPVRLITVPGNHDQQSTLFLSLLLQQAFSGDARVRFEDQADGNAYVDYGNNSVLIAHGDHLKEKDIFRVMVSAAEERSLPLRRHKMAVVGHVHHEQVKDLGGIKLHVSPSLSEPDSWHRYSNYVGSAIEAQAFVIRRSGGKAMTIYSHPEIVGR